jgi:beta-propeller repeat-containing protein
LKIKSDLIGHVFGLAFIASCVALQVPSQLVYSSGELSRCLDRSPSVADRTGSHTVARSYGDLPLSFEVNRGQSDSRVKFLARGGGYNLYLTAKEAVMGLRAPAAPSLKNERRHSVTAGAHPSFIGMKLVGANAGARIIGLDEMPGKSNYFIGSDPKKWRVNIPNYSRVKYHNAYPGVDVVFYGKGRQLEYDFIVAPGADFRTARIAFEGVRGIRLDASGDLLIATSSGEIRELKPAMYQEADGAKQPVEGGYVIRGEREIGFEVRHYDSNRALVIDPVMIYSTTFGGSFNESANAIAVDNSGNAYIAGTTNSTDFPTVNPFQQKLGRANAFVAKMNPAGTALLYSTYLGGSTYLGRGTSDGANGIAVDADGSAYVAGYVASLNFPTTPDAFQRKAVTGGSAFVTKLSAAGNALVYSTYLGGTGSNDYFSPNTASVSTSIAVGADGSAYTTGYTLSQSFPLKKAAQDQFNRGVPFNSGSGCPYQFLLSPSPMEDAFVTKLNPSGTGLVYSTYLGGTGQDEAYGIAIDPSGNAYVTGRTCSTDFTSGGHGGGTNAFVVKLSSSGREFMYSVLLGGNGDEVGSGIAVDTDGNAYVTGQTDSIDFPSTRGALQSSLGGSSSYATTDGGVSWITAAGLPRSPVNVLALDPANPLTVYAGLGSCSTALGLFKSTDGGHTWKASGLTNTLVRAIAVDPKNPSTVYADVYKSTDAGATWTHMAFPHPLFVDGVDKLAIDPLNTETLYLHSEAGLCSDFLATAFLKTTDGGGTWSRILNGGSNFGADSQSIDPKNPSTIYATGPFPKRNLYKSTDNGNTWRVPYEGDHDLVLLAIDPTNTSTLYLRNTPSYINYTQNNLLKSTDGGASFTVTGLTGVPIGGVVVDQTNSSTLYAATGDLGGGGMFVGGVFKSTDGGQTWNTTDLTGTTVNALAIDPLNSSRIYAGTYFDTDGFLAKVNAAGTGLIYSTYLGTRSPDVIAGIGIDGAGNTYVTGNTFSDRFPATDALLATKPGGQFDSATFVTKLNATGSAILFSTYLGGSEPGFGSGIAVDAAGKLYIAGTTGTFRNGFPGALPNSVHGGFDAFVIKIASPPRITGASISGNDLVVAGEGFDRGAVILVDGAEQRTRNYESRTATVLIGKKTAKIIAPGQTVTIRVRNSDGLISETLSFTR